MRPRKEPPGSPGGFNGGQVNLSCPRAPHRGDPTTYKETHTRSYRNPPLYLGKLAKNEIEESLYRVQIPIVPFVFPLVGFVQGFPGLSGAQEIPSRSLKPGAIKDHVTPILNRVPTLTPAIGCLAHVCEPAFLRASVRSCPGVGGEGVPVPVRPPLPRSLGLSVVCPDCLGCLPDPPFRAHMGGHLDIP